MFLITAASNKTSQVADSIASMKISLQYTTDDVASFTLQHWSLGKRKHMAGDCEWYNGSTS